MTNPCVRAELLYLAVFFLFFCLFYPLPVARLYNCRRVDGHTQAHPERGSAAHTVVVDLGEVAIKPARLRRQDDGVGRVRPHVIQLGTRRSHGEVKRRGGGWAGAGRR